MSQFSLLFFFNDTATTEIYTLSLHDALPISIAPPRAVHVRGDLEIEPLRLRQPARPGEQNPIGRPHHEARGERIGDRKSTRLNSSHLVISYAVFCLKKKKINTDLSRAQHNQH